MRPNCQIFGSPAHGGETPGQPVTSLNGIDAPRGDLAVRRSIERVVFEVRTEIAKVCLEMADKCGEPPLSEQG